MSNTRNKRMQSFFLASLFLLVFYFFPFVSQTCFQGEYFRILLLIRSGDTETKIGRKKQSCLKIFLQNLDGLASHDFTKPPLIEI